PDNNYVAAFDIDERAESKVLGFIPSGWYPSAIAASPDGKRLYVGTAKGMSSAPNGTDKRYIGQILSGHVSVVDVPDENQLARYTQQVLSNTPVGRKREDLTPAERLVLDQTVGKIKHVLYINKENGTYDQLFGAIKQCNG